MVSWLLLGCRRPRTTSWLTAERLRIFVVDLTIVWFRREIGFHRREYFAVPQLCVSEAPLKMTVNIPYPIPDLDVRIIQSFTKIMKYQAAVHHLADSKASSGDLLRGKKRVQLPIFELLDRFSSDPGNLSFLENCISLALGLK